MAAADYRLCDVCDGKVFYDANLNYEQGRDSEWAKGKPPFRWAGEDQGKPEHDDWLLRLDYLGDWAVICSDCAKTHKTIVAWAESHDAAVAKQPTEAWQLLADLVAGLEATHWSSWQTTAHFDSALDAARAALAAREINDADR